MLAVNQWSGYETDGIVRQRVPPLGPDNPAYPYREDSATLSAASSGRRRDRPTTRGDAVEENRVVIHRTPAVKPRVKRRAKLLANEGATASGAFSKNLGNGFRYTRNGAGNAVMELTSETMAGGVTSANLRRSVRGLPPIPGTAEGDGGGADEDSDQLDLGIFQSLKTPSESIAKQDLDLYHDILDDVIKIEGEERLRLRRTQSLFSVTKSGAEASDGLTKRWEGGGGLGKQSATLEARSSRGVGGGAGRKSRGDGLASPTPTPTMMIPLRSGIGDVIFRGAESDVDISHIVLELKMRGYSLHQGPGHKFLSINMSTFKNVPEILAFLASEYEAVAEMIKAGTKARKMLAIVVQDALIAQLKQQVADLNLYLEEERLAHKNTAKSLRQRAEEKEKEAESRHQQRLMDLLTEHDEEMKRTGRAHEDEMAAQREAAEATTSRLRGELEFLQSAFDNYKAELKADMDEKWRKWEEDLKMRHQEELDAALHELRAKMLTEKTAEKASLIKEHQKQIQLMTREHKRDMEAITRRFSSAAADIERLKKALEELKDVQTEMEDLKVKYEIATKELENCQSSLAKAEVKLIGFEEHFHEMVGEVDEKYQTRIHDLMVRNTDLRRMFVGKCEELFQLQNAIDFERRRQDLGKDAAEVAALESLHAHQ